MIGRLTNRLIRKRFLTPVPARGAALTRRRIYILPTRHGLLFASMLLVMLLGALNYNNSLSLALTFLMASAATISIVHAYRNLAGMHVAFGRADPVFAGETVRFPVTLTDGRGLARPRVRVEARGGASETIDVPAGAAARTVLRASTTRRGRVAPGRCRISTRHPLGLFRAWSWVVPTTTCVVYPAPSRESPPLARPPSDTTGAAASDAAEGDDFAGLRAYRTSDSPRHVAWKAVARGQGWMTKRFAGAAATTPLWLEWDDLPDADTEARLSWLCRAALDAERGGHPYGLRLPDTTIAPQRGPEHARRVLTALATFGLDTPNATDTDD